VRFSVSREQWERVLLDTINLEVTLTDYFQRMLDRGWTYEPGLGWVRECSPFVSVEIPEKPLLQLPAPVRRE